MIRTVRLVPAAFLFPLLPFALPALVGDAPTADEAETVATTDDERGWRDASDAQRRARWDRLEGHAAPTLEGLVDWTTASAKSWSDLRGKVVVLDFWATWCAPCREEAPKLQALHERFASEGLVILGVHAPRGRETMRAFVEREKLSYTFASDATGASFDRYGVESVPTLMVVDKRGVLRVAGANRAKTTEIVEHLLAEPSPSTPAAPVPNWPAIVEKELYAKVDLRGKPAPELAFGDWLTARPELEGKAILIDFWATWCGPCVKTIPELNAFHDEFGEDLAVIGISKEDAAVVRAFVEETPVRYALSVDSTGALSDAVGVEGIPHVLLLSSDGIVRWQGYPLSEEERLTTAIVRRVLDSDPAVFERRRARAERRSGGAGGTQDAPTPPE